MPSEFTASWDELESDYYDCLETDAIPAVKEFVARLREAGFNETLRAGHSLWFLMLSRSIRHELNEDTSYVSFDFRRGKLLVKNNIKCSLEDKMIEFPEIRFNMRINYLLKELEGIPAV